MELKSHFTNNNVYLSIVSENVSKRMKKLSWKDCTNSLLKAGRRNHFYSDNRSVVISVRSLNETYPLHPVESIETWSCKATEHHTEDEMNSWCLLFFHDITPFHLTFLTSLLQFLMSEYLPRSTLNSKQNIQPRWQLSRSASCWYFLLTELTFLRHH